MVIGMFSYLPVRLAARIQGTPSAADCWRVPTRRKDRYATFGDRRPACLGEIYAHRISWRLANGNIEIPSHLEIDHICRVRNCINPTHLRVVDHAGNMARIIGSGQTWRIYPLTGTCGKGHPWQDTAVRNTQGRWICVLCRREAGHRHDLKRRAKN